MNEHIGYWVLVYLEPIEVSDERVVIGIVAKDVDGKVFSQLALSAEGLHENGRRLAKIIDIKKTVLVDILTVLINNHIVY